MALSKNLLNDLHSLMWDEQDIDEPTWVHILCHLVSKTTVSYRDICCISENADLGFKGVCTVLKHLEKAPLDDKRMPSYLYDMICYLIGVRHDRKHVFFNKEQQAVISEIIFRYPYKSRLLTCNLLYQRPLYDVLQFLLKECWCDPNEKNPDSAYWANATLVGIFFDFYPWKEPLTDEIELIKVLLVKEGGHVCKKSKEPISLQCLTAVCISRNELDINRLPKRLRYFVDIHE